LRKKPAAWPAFFISEPTPPASFHAGATFRSDIFFDALHHSDIVVDWRHPPSRPAPLRLTGSQE
jgi:hypothetical protein